MEARTVIDEEGRVVTGDMIDAAVRGRLAELRQVFHLSDADRERLEKRAKRVLTRRRRSPR